MTPTQKGFYWVRWSELARRRPKDGGLGIDPAFREDFVIRFDPERKPDPIELAGSDEEYRIEDFDWLEGPIKRQVQEGID